MSTVEELLPILVCPISRTALESIDDGNGLRCPRCQRVYPICEGVPVLLASESCPVPKTG